MIWLSSKGTPDESAIEPQDSLSKTVAYSLINSAFQSSKSLLNNSLKYHKLGITLSSLAVGLFFIKRRGYLPATKQHLFQLNMIYSKAQKEHLERFKEVTQERIILRSQELHAFIKQYSDHLIAVAGSVTQLTTQVHKLPDRLREPQMNSIKNGQQKIESTFIEQRKAYTELLRFKLDDYLTLLQTAHNDIQGDISEVKLSEKMLDTHIAMSFQELSHLIEQEYSSSESFSLLFAQIGEAEHTLSQLVRALTEQCSSIPSSLHELDTLLRQHESFLQGVTNQGSCSQ